MFQGTYYVRKINMELVLLREFSTIEPGSHWGSVIYACLILGDTWFSDHLLS